MTAWLRKQHTRSVFLWVLSPYWPHQGINKFLSDNLCSTLNLELDMEEEWHCKILVDHNSGWNIQVYKIRAKIQFYYAEREKLSFMLLQFSLHWHFIVRTIRGFLPTADIMVTEVTEVVIMAKNPLSWIRTLLWDENTEQEVYNFCWLGTLWV